MAPNDGPSGTQFLSHVKQLERELLMLSVVGFKVAARVQCIIYNNLDKFRGSRKGVHDL